MGKIIIGTLFLLIGSCTGYQALIDRNSVSALGGGIIAIVLILCAVAFIAFGLRAFMKKPTTIPPAPQENLRKCPFCAEMIKPDAIKCRFCGSDVPAIQLDQPAGIKCPQCDFVFVGDFSSKEGWWCPNCQQTRY